MESKPTRISEWSLNEIREIGKAIGSPSDDTIIRHVIAEYKRLKTENELLKKKLSAIKPHDD
jgi:capsule polysaccharide export protein KpsE/RkpR